MNKKLKYIPIGIVLAFCYALDFIIGICCVPLPSIFVVWVFLKDSELKKQLVKWIAFNVVIGQIVVFVLRLIRDIIPIHRPADWVFYAPAMVGIPIGIFVVWWSYKRIIGQPEQSDD